MSFVALVFTRDFRTYVAGGHTQKKTSTGIFMILVSIGKLSSGSPIVYIYECVRGVEPDTSAHQRHHLGHKCNGMACFWNLVEHKAEIAGWRQDRGGTVQEV